MLLTYQIVDVFTRTRFGGNPLAVVLGSDNLTTDQMQAVAPEFNSSETSFVLQPADAHHTAQVRIFTPTLEVPFAGHPNISAAFVLAGRATGPRGRVCVRGESRLVHVGIVWDGIRQLKTAEDLVAESRGASLCLDIRGQMHRHQRLDLGVAAHGTRSGC